MYIVIFIEHNNYSMKKENELLRNPFDRESFIPSIIDKDLKDDRKE